MATGTDLGRLEPAVEIVVLPAVHAHGLMLVDLEIRGNGRRVAVRLYVDKPVVEDGNLITSRKPDDVPFFNQAIVRALTRA